MKKIIIFTIILILLFIGCGQGGSSQSGVKKMTKNNENDAIATLAGGCFWCVESDFEKLPGVVKVISGYTGGKGESPNYENYARGGYIEAVQVYYDPKILTYEQILNYFWRHIDPTDKGGQFVDRGPQYRTAIFYHNEEQRKIAERTKQSLEKSGKLKKPVVTEIIKFEKFYPAEDYHQNYYKKKSPAL
jgi:peptide methionine sulfoxide reductase msrA/msrB